MDRLPHIERYSTGWRMGYGEDYISRWGRWHSALGEVERAEYHRLFPEPVEASPCDGVWGIRMDQSNEKVKDPFAWRGQNLLGFALMEVRDGLRRVWENADLCKDVVPEL